MLEWIARLLSAVALVASQSAAPTAPPPPVQPPVQNIGTAIEAGYASFVDASYGSAYLALPHGRRGTLVTVTGPRGDVTRRSTDVGPDQRVFPDRVVDLSYHDFGVVCGHDKGQGTCRVTVEYLTGSSGGPKATLPPTDTEH